MAEQKAPKKNQLSLDEYQKIKVKRAKSRLQLNIPPLVHAIVAVPAVFLTFIILYYLIHVRFLAEH